MVSESLVRIASVSAFTAAFTALALSISYLSNNTLLLFPSVGDFPIPDFSFASPLVSALLPRPIIPSASSFVCDANHSYETSLVSLDPLVMYIHSLLSPSEIASLLDTAELRFSPSEVVKRGRDLRTPDRTSSSAGLPRDDPAVQCVLARARRFLGTMMRDSFDDMGPPQLVRYHEGQRFNIHHDWYKTPRPASEMDRTTGTRWNRVASFFAVLQDNCTGGETHFPYIDGIAPPSPQGDVSWAGAVGEGRPLWREHKDGGLAFRPVAGNAIFWVNLFPNGTGDERTMHAGSPVEQGIKTAMNIWPRRYYP